MTEETYTFCDAWFCAAHEPKGGGPIHGHTWRVRAWWRYRGRDAEGLADTLRKVCATLDHTKLPDHLSRAEDIARWIGVETLADRVKVWREPEGLGALWIR